MKRSRLAVFVSSAAAFAALLSGCATTNKVLKAEPAPDSGFLQEADKMSDMRTRAPFHRAWVDPAYSSTNYGSIVVAPVNTDYVEARKFYDYNEHSRVGTAHGEFVTDEICDRFSVLGDVGQITAKLRELESIGVDHFSIYLMTHGQEETLEAYGRDVIPQFASAAA